MSSKRTIVTLAQSMNKHLKMKTRKDKSEFYALDAYGQKTGWMTDVIRIAHGDKFPDDTVYVFIHRIVSHVSELDTDKDLYDVMDSILDMEPDVYTHDLTAWLHASVDHVYYIDEVLEEYGKPNSGFDLLQLAQLSMIRQIGNALVDALDDVLK